MNKKLTLTIIAIGLLLLLTGCSVITSFSEKSDDSQSEGSETYTQTNTTDNYQMLPLISGKNADIELDASADNTTQRLKVGEILAITLESNVTTGFSWHLTISDPKVVVQIGEPLYQDPPSDSGTPTLGAAGKQTFFMQAVETGTVIVSLEYEQSFETDVAAEKTINFTVDVK